LSWNTKPKVVIPSYLLLVCNSIQQKFPGMEFSILVQPAEIKPYTIILSTDYAIPKQEVSGASVDYDGDDMLKKIEEGYTVVIHSHHSMASSFSGTDEEYLHSHGNLIASILFAQGTFKTAKILINNPLFGVAKIDADVEIQYPEVDVSNITKKEPKVTKPTTTPVIRESRGGKSYIKDTYVLYCELCDKDYEVDSPVEPCPECNTDQVIIFPRGIYGFG